MAYYVEPEYWVEGYAVGDAKLIAASSNANTEADVSASIVALTGIAAESQSNALSAPLRVLSAACKSSAESQVYAGSPIVTTFGFLSTSTSTLSAAGTLLLKAGLSSVSNGTMAASFRLRWEDDQEPIDAWLTVSEPSDLWTDVTEPTDSWS